MQKNKFNDPITIKDLLIYVLSIRLKNLISTLILFLATFSIFNSLLEHLNTFQDRTVTKTNPENRKLFRIYSRNINNRNGHLKHVYLVLERLGFHEYQKNDTNWDLLWAHDYPFRVLQNDLTDLKPEQKVNHFPGCGFITNKVDLATSGLKYVPVAFKIPQQKSELITYAQTNPGRKFVQKSNEHRNIKMKELQDLNLTNPGTFVQEYVDNPLLIDGHKFDIGVYTIITSVDPLRLYIYNGDILFRFCSEKYYPFDPENLGKYVVGDDYLPIWNVPSLKYYYNVLGFSMRDSFDAFVKGRGLNPEKMWWKIEDSIRNVVLTKEESIISAMQRYKSKRNFFEMMRFDFVVDEHLNVYIMEANMSPNLSSAHYPPNQLLYEQVLYNLFSLIGIAKRIHEPIQNHNEKSNQESMLTSDKNLMVFPEECNSDLCKMSGCIAPECQLCRMCLTPEMKRTLIQAHREYLNRLDCKRIFPPPLNRTVVNSSMDLEMYSVENQLQYRWFIGKCLLDSSWC